MKKYVIAAIITTGFIGLGILCLRPSKPSDTFYLRSYRTGRLIGPISRQTGCLLPPLYEQSYIIADPTDSELKITKCLLDTPVYESNYYDCTLADVVDTINQMLKHQLGDKAPPIRIELPDESKTPLITMILSGEPAYDALCNIADKTQVQVLVKNDTVVLSQR